MNIKFKISSQEKEEYLKRERETIHLITGITYREVMNTYSFKELLHLQAALLFFSAI